MPAPLPNPDGTTSHSTKPADGQVAGYLPQAGEGANDHYANLSIFLADEAETLALAKRLATALKPGLVIYLHGDLGAGKTTLVRGVLNALGHTGRVKSPTYTLLETYCVNGLDLRHFDLYRLNDEEEWESAGFRDEFDGNNIFFIEWPEKAQGFLPPADMEIDLEMSGNGRTAVLAAHTRTGCECLERLLHSSHC